MSLISPATGVQTEESRSSGGSGIPPTPQAATSDESLQVPLYHARWRHFAWAAFLVGIGALLFVSLGSFGRIAGVALLAFAIPPTIEFARTLAHEAGTIGVSSQGVALPPRLCAGLSAEMSFGDVKHAYFLRRVLPFMTTGPLLVVETARGTFAYPRDWFASETDQRRVVNTINRRVARARTGRRSRERRAGRASRRWKRLRSPAPLRQGRSRRW